jgi:hypothetical protein
MKEQLISCTFCKYFKVICKENITSLTTAITQEQTTVLTTSKVIPTISTESSTSDRNEPINEVLNVMYMTSHYR